MRGIILAGGSGTRLYPLTRTISKQLLPVYDKPMIYYPLSVLMMAGIRDILIISTPQDIGRFEKLLGDGQSLGIKISYIVQDKPNGIAEALILGDSFISDEACCLILGDNIFYGAGLRNHLLTAKENAEKGFCTVFGYKVIDPTSFGVVEFDQDFNVLSIEEKPKKPKSNYAVTGLYFYPKGVSDKAKTINRSQRGELEITDLNACYLKDKKLIASLLGRGYSWLDTGTIENLFEAASFIKSIEVSQNVQICCPEEIAFNNKWIDANKLLSLSNDVKNTKYGDYLKSLCEKND